MKHLTFLITTCLFFLISFSGFSQNVKYRKFTHSTTATFNCSEAMPDSGNVAYGFDGTSPGGQSIARFDNEGNLLWAKRIVIGTFSCEGRAVKVTSNNHIVLLSTTNGDAIALTHLDFNGSVLSCKTFPNVHSYAIFDADIIEDPNGFIYATIEDVLIKTDLNGELKWRKKIPVSDIRLTEVDQLSPSKLVLSGTCINQIAPSSTQDVIRIEIDTAGTIGQVINYGTAHTEVLLESFIVGSNQYMFFTRYPLNPSVGIPNEGLHVLCLDSLGNQLWGKAIDSSNIFSSNINTVKLLNNHTFALITTYPNIPTFIQIDLSGNIISKTELTNYPNLLSSFDPTCILPDGNVVTIFRKNNSYNIDWVKFNNNLKSTCFNDSLLSMQQSVPFLLDSKIITPVTSSSSSFTNRTTTITNIVMTASALVCSNPCNLISKIQSSENRVCLGDSITFTSLTDSASNVLWKIDGDTVSLDSIVSFTFNQPGEHFIELISIGQGCQDTALLTIYVDTPISSINFNTQQEQLAVQFTAISNPNAICIWNFNDNTALESNNIVNHTFSELGDHIVCLKQQNVCGFLESCDTISVVVDSSYSFRINYSESPATGDSRGNAIVTELGNGDFIIGFRDDTYDFEEVGIMRTNEKGIPLWTKAHTFNQSNFTFKHFTELSSGHIAVVATANNYCYFGIIDSSGTMTNYKRFYTGSISGMTMVKPYELEDGSIVYFGSYYNETFYLRVNTNLEVLEMKKYLVISKVQSVIKTNSGFLLTGMYYDDPTIAKLDFNGNFIEAKLINIDGYSSYSTALEITDDNHILMTGYITGTLAQGTNKNFVLRMDTLYNIQWIKTYQFTSNTSGLGTGTTISSDASNNIFVLFKAGSWRYFLKLNDQGDVIWSVNNPSAPTFFNHIETRDNGILMSANASSDISLIKFDGGQQFPSCLAASLATIYTADLSAQVSSQSNVTTLGSPALTSISTTFDYNETYTIGCFTGSPNIISNFSYLANCQNHTYNFQDNSTSIEPILSRNWSFAGGSPATSTSQSPVITWSAPGIYSATLTIITASDTVSSTQQIVFSGFPVANAGSDIDICYNQGISLQGSGIGTLQWNVAPAISNAYNPTSYFWADSTQNLILNASLSGCTIKDTVHVVVHPNFWNTVNVTICNGEQYPFFGNSLTTSGFYSQSFTDQYGCDSTYSVDLSVLNQVIHTDLHEAYCGSVDTYFDGIHITSPGVYNAVFTSVSGCDSTVTLTIELGTDYNGEITVEQCEEYIWPATGMIYFNSGTYIINLTGQAGCDSTITLNLTINHDSNSSSSITSCNPYIWPVNGITYNTSGIYYATLTNSTGCDSIVELNLTINNDNLYSTVINSCEPFFWQPTGLTYSEGGTYYSFNTASNGCDSTLELVLIVSPLTALATDNGSGTLSASVNSNYQWINCSTDEPIIGQTNQNFIATNNGSYAVICSNSAGCIDTSDCIIVDYLKIGELKQVEISLYPNPTSDQVRIVMGNDTFYSLTVRDAMGKCVLQLSKCINNEKVSLKNFSDGVYFFEFSNESETIVQKIVKETH